MPFLTQFCCISHFIQNILFRSEICVFPPWFDFSEVRQACILFGEPKSSARVAIILRSRDPPPIWPSWRPGTDFQPIRGDNPAGRTPVRFFLWFFLPVRLWENFSCWFFVVFLWFFPWRVFFGILVWKNFDSEKFLIFAPIYPPPKAKICICHFCIFGNFLQNEIFPPAEPKFFQSPLQQKLYILGELPKNFTYAVCVYFAFICFFLRFFASHFFCIF